MTNPTPPAAGPLSIAGIFDVRDLSVLVTGATSGLGLAIARALAANGARVTALGLEPERIDATLAVLRAESETVRAEAVDVTDAVALHAAVERTVEAQGGLDVLFANAGVGGGPGFAEPRGGRRPGGAFEQIGADRWQTQMDVNLHGVFHAIQAAVPHMQRRGGGSIVVTTSIAALKTEAVIGAPYMVMKAAAANLVRQAALELARDGIRVNAIAPGPFQTNVSGGRMFEPAVRAHHERAVPMRRMAQPDEIAGLALLLASPASSYITGAQLVIDGGATLGRGDWDEETGS